MTRGGRTKGAGRALLVGASTAWTGSDWREANTSGHSSRYRGSTSAIITIAFAAGAPSMVTRPLIEAVRGRSLRCGVCALDWLTITRSNIGKAEQRLSRTDFTDASLAIVAQTVRLGFLGKFPRSGGA